MANILVADDASDILKALEVILSRAEHNVFTAVSGEKALRSIEAEDIDLLLCDVKMPYMDGLTVLRRVKSIDPSIAVVMISGHHEVETAVVAMQEGAYDYLLKPLQKEDILRAVQRALSVRSLHIENLLLKRQVRDHFARAQVIGSSPAWRQVRQMVEQVASSQATVLITGESGTGKERIAELVHSLSSRADKPFIVLNAAALPATLLEAELFGYEKGAFTGAFQRKPGHFEMADGGTLFLDEIGDMPMEVQAKLLRVLQDGSFKRLGGTRTQYANVRVVAATNKNLVQEVAAERFRQDLYYRLNVITLRLPPLRERPQDIPLLAAYFVKKYAQENQKQVTAIRQEALQQLQSYSWPGNIRELENVMERAVVLAHDSAISVAELSLEESISTAPDPQQCFMLPATSTMAEIERTAIVQALEHHHGNRQAVARQLGIGPATLYRKFKVYDIR